MTKSFVLQHRVKRHFHISELYRSAVLLLYVQLASVLDVGLLWLFAGMLL